MCFAGSIRGAIAFGLAISIQTNYIKNRLIIKIFKFIENFFIINNYKIFDLH